MGQALPEFFDTTPVNRGVRGIASFAPDGRIRYPAAAAAES